MAVDRSRRRSAGHRDVLALGLLVSGYGPNLMARAGGPSAALAGSPDAPHCAVHVQVRLFFGLATPHGTVSDAEWTRFLSEVITPRFPRGLTLVHADGQWQAPGEDAITREPSRVVEIVDPGGPAMERGLRDIVTAYRKRFHQHSVMLTRGRVEVCF